MMNTNNTAMPETKGMPGMFAVFIAVLTASRAMAGFAGFKLTQKGFTTTLFPKSVVVLELK